MKILLQFLTLILFAMSAQATEEVLSFDNEAQRQLYQQLTAELRCPQCQNQNIADSNAIVSVDMRQKTYDMIKQGRQRDDVLDYMINRYGNFVHYQPPLNRYTLLLWLAPLLMLLALVALQVKRRRQQANESSAEIAEQPVSAPLDAELDKLIEQYRSKK
ncbi:MULTISPECIES: cytochrome c-type biogenesis protein [unclassified Arsukibacterium]|uniref:cytochrome c-type biogenesis protein n=1 Tax=unclassified Arsukibacterium TaxID=2635278 RepID=UPI000C949390|nr:MULTISPECIES: cytochrome c-type biogenesis protein [unclassified Arsukibacterium]MAA95103.1 cytochrome C biogenesis protein [Rheinheimera sp.]HAW94478.1 cytochrome c-type biogenesis protein CcmH [Candidatus Azambacteria bacterium]|tara:strand:+ start:12187 stop:12666 length:480 start_codon:yes stop_codon:yes gene_type:complete